MSFDRSKVQFNDEDLRAAEALDKVYEALRDVDKFSLTLVMEQIANIQIITDYLLEGNSREDLADKLFDLGVMFKRDNIDFGRPSVSDEG